MSTYAIADAINKFADNFKYAIGAKNQIEKEKLAFEKEKFEFNKQQSQSNKPSADDFNVPFAELLWEGQTISGVFMRGQLFRFQGHYYICDNIPIKYEECVEKGWYPPTVGWWHEMIPSTLKKCGWEYED